MSNYPSVPPRPPSPIAPLGPDHAIAHRVAPVIVKWQPSKKDMMVKAVITTWGGAVFGFLVGMFTFSLMGILASFIIAGMLWEEIEIDPDTKS